MAEPFIGQIKMVGFDFAPRGFALCNGQLLPIAQNTAVFSLLGTTFGGDGRPTFGVPDLRGRVPVHAGGGIPGPGLSARTLGLPSGTETVSVLSTQIPAHVHASQAVLPATNLPATQTDPAGRALAAPADGSLAYAAAATGTSGGPLSASTGSGQPHPNMQPSLVINFIIALQGIFPSRA